MPCNRRSNAAAPPSHQAGRDRRRFRGAQSQRDRRDRAEQQPNHGAAGGRRVDLTARWRHRNHATSRSVSATERTSEIGLRMAIGALRLHVLLQFLAEAVLISVNGGIAGHRHRCCSVPGRFVAGSASTGLGRRHCRRFPVLSRRGNLLRRPSRTQAAHLDPIKALRYE